MSTKLSTFLQTSIFEMQPSHSFSKEVRYQQIKYLRRKELKVTMIVCGELASSCFRLVLFLFLFGKGRTTDYDSVPSRV